MSSWWLIWKSKETNFLELPNRYLRVVPFSDPVDAGQQDGIEKVNPSLRDVASFEASSPGNVLLKWGGLGTA